MSGPQRTSCRATPCGAEHRSARSCTRRAEAGRGAQLCRSAGTQAQLLAKEGDRATLESCLRRGAAGLLACMATIGQCGNLDHENVSIGKAAASAGCGSVRRSADRDESVIIRWAAARGRARASPDDAVGEADEGIQTRRGRQALGTAPS